MSGGPESKKQLGKILLAQKLVSADVLQEMLDEQKRAPGSRLASTATRTGRISMQDALLALAEQHGLPAVDLTREVVALATLRLIPVEMARERLVLAFRSDGEHLLLAMASPKDNELIDELAFITGKKITAYVALDQVLREAIAYAYAALERNEEYFVGAYVTDAQLAALGLSDKPRAPAPKSEPPPVVRESALEQSAGDRASAADSGLGRDALDEAFSQPLRPSQRPHPVVLQSDRRVLVAHSDAHVRALLARALHDAGITVLETDDGARVEDLAHRVSPTLLVLEPGLPGVHGFEICRRLRRSEAGRALPILVIGGADCSWRLEQDLNEAFGIRHFFEPPLDTFKFIRSVRLLFEGQAEPEEPPALSSEAEAKWHSAMACFEGGDLDTAIARLEEGLAVDPEAFELHYHLGLLYGQRDDLFAAIAALETAVSQQPKHFSAAKNLAVVYQRVGFWRKAVDAWQQAMGAAADDETRSSIKQHLMSLM